MGNQESQGKFCPKTSIIIGSVWYVCGVIFYFGKGHIKFGIGPLLLVHIAFFVFFICSILFSYMAFALKAKIVAEENAKQKEFDNKKVLEGLQREKYEEAKRKEVEENDFNKKVKDACKTILKEWQDSYQENLKSLGANVKLYNEVKKIIEEKPEVGDNKEAKSNRK